MSGILTMQPLNLDYHQTKDLFVLIESSQ